jgi:membrane protein implicated in regulation of membrane protease activity
MAALFLLLAVLGAILVGDLVLENTATGAITMLNHPITGYSDGLLLAMTAVLGFVVGLLVVGSVSLRRACRVRRKQLRVAERELSGQLIELERENAGLREDLTGRDLAARRLSGAAAAADLGSPAETARWAPRPPADRQGEPVYDEARRVARLRSNSDLSFLSTNDQARA